MDPAAARPLAALASPRSGGGAARGAAEPGAYVNAAYVYFISCVVRFAARSRARLRALPLLWVFSFFAARALPSTSLSLLSVCDLRAIN